MAEAKKEARTIKEFRWKFMNDSNNFLVSFLALHIIDISSTASAYYGGGVERNWIIRNLLGTPLLPFFEIGIILGIILSVRIGWDRSFFGRFMMWMALVFILFYAVIPNVIRLFLRFDITLFI